MLHHTNDIPPKINRILEDWIINFKDYLERIIDAGGTPIVITISCKMPRLLQYINEIYIEDEEFKRQWSKTISQCEFTTEHAIPFIFSGESKSNRNYLGQVCLLDDLSYTGKTILDTLYYLDNILQDPPAVSVIFMGKDSLVCFQPWFLNWGTSPEYRMSKEEIRESADFINEAILKVSLPVDVEFPILHFKDDNSPFHKIKNNKSLEFDHEISSLIYDLLKNRNSGINSENLVYSIIHKEFEKIAISVVSNNEYNWGYNSDFSKIRIFHDFTTGETKYVPFCANIISKSDIYKENLFENPLYDIVWTILRNHVLQNGWSIESVWDELAVSVNYLYSLAYIIRNSDNVLIDGLRKEILEFEDLKLLYGSEMANRIKPMLENIFLANDGTPTRNGRYITLPSRLGNRRLEQKYEVESKMILFNEWEKGIPSVLSSVFDLSHFYDGKLYQDKEKPIYASEGFYESFASLKSFISIYIEDKDMDLKIHKWLDENIDKGKIVPCYLKVEGGDGLQYLKRFFTLSASIPQV